MSSLTCNVAERLSTRRESARLATMTTTHDPETGAPVADPRAAALDLVEFRLTELLFMIRGGRRSGDDLINAVDHLLDLVSDAR